MCEVFNIFRMFFLIGFKSLIILQIVFLIHIWQEILCSSERYVPLIRFVHQIKKLLMAEWLNESLLTFCIAIVMVEDIIVSLSC